MSGVDLVGWQTVTTEHAGVLLAVWGKGTAALLPAMKGRWLRVDECRHDILRFIARVVLLNLACVNITGASPLGFTRVASLDVTSDGGAEVVMLWIVPSFYRPVSSCTSCFFSTFRHYIRRSSAHLTCKRSLVTPYYNHYPWNPAS